MFRQNIWYSDCPHSIVTYNPVVFAQNGFTQLPKYGFPAPIFQNFKV